MTDNEYFLDYIGKNYDEIKKRFKSYCYNKHQPWSEDIFQETIIKCHDLIKKNGEIKDKSNQGIENLFFMAFKTNIIRELEYAYVKNRDENITGEALKDKYEEYKQYNEISSEDKVLKDAFQDFSVNYILSKVEENFNTIDFRLFRIKLFYNTTYKKIKELTKIGNSKQRIVNVQKWIKDNISKEELKEAFEEYQQQL